MSNWWDKIQMAVGRSKDVVITPSDPEGRNQKATLTSPEWVSAPMMGSPRHINFLELEEYEEDVTVQAAVNYIIDSIATSDWNIIPDEDMVDEGEEVDNSDAVKFFKSKDWEESFDTVLRGVIADILLYDSGVVVVMFPGFCYDENKTLIKNGVPPLSLRARDGRSFIKQVDMYGKIMKYWQYSFLHTATKPVEFDQEEIIYMQERPSTRSPYGTSKLEVVKNVADLMMAVQVGHRAENENALQIGGVISHSDVTDPEKLKRLSAMYNSTLKGEHNKKRWLTTGGNVDVKPINASVADDSWIPGSEFYQQQILSIFKVPKTVLGITSSDTNRATAFAQSANFKRFGVATMMTLIDRIFTREIVKKYFNEKLVFRFVREVDLADEAIRADIDAKNVATGVRTVNELRTRDGLEEIEEPEEGEGGYAFDEYGEYEGMESLTPEEVEEIGKGFGINFNKTTVHVPASGGRKEYTYERTSAQTQHTDMLTTGIESIMYKREAMMQAGDVVEGIDPEIGRQRREVKAAGRNILISMDRKVPVIPGEHYTVGMKELVERGDIEKKKGGKGYKLTTQGKARVKEINEFALRATVNVPTKSESGAESHEKVLVSQYLNQMEYASRHLKSVEKSGGTNRIWIKPTSNRKGHWRNVKPGKGDDKGDKPKKRSDKEIDGLATLKSELVKCQKESDDVESKLKAMGEKYRSAGTTEKRELDKDAEKIYAEKESLDKRRDEVQIKIDRIEYDRDKKNKSPDVQIDPKNRIAGFSDDFILIYETDQIIKDRIMGNTPDKEQLSRSEYDDVRDKYQKLVNLYGREKYMEESDKYQRIVDQRKKAAGIPIDPRNKTPVTDSSIFNFKDGKNNLEGMTRDEGLEQLRAGGWNFENASFGLGEEADYDYVYGDTNILVENGIVYGEYGTTLHDDGSFEIGHLQVNADMQRLGYGKKIMGHAIQDALDSGADKIGLHSMNSDSNKFYRAIGMEEVSNKIFEGDKTWMKEYLEGIKNV